MYPWSHFLFGFLIGLVFVKLGYFGYGIAILIGILAVLVDLDHYFYYGIKHKTWNFRKAWNAGSVIHEKGERTFIHHLKGFIIMAFISAIIFLISRTFGIVVASAYYSHMALDYWSWNFIKIRGEEKFKEKKFSFSVPNYELFWDGIFIAGIVLLFVF